MIDRQLLVSPERTPTLGTVTRATDSSFNCEVSFRGRAYECKSAGKNALAVGDSVSFVQIDQTPWVIKSDALYPTRFKRPLTDWAGHHKYNLLLQYLISRGARKNYTFQFGTAQSVVSTNVLSVNCWDGRTRSLLVEYAGVLRPASDFVVGDQVLVYQKTPQNWAVVGKAYTANYIRMKLRHRGIFNNHYMFCLRDGADNGIDEYVVSSDSQDPSMMLDPFKATQSTETPHPASSSLLATNITGSGIKIIFRIRSGNDVPNPEYTPTSSEKNIRINVFWETGFYSMSSAESGNQITYTINMVYGAGVYPAVAFWLRILSA